jgi:hypothetical protein
MAFTAAVLSWLAAQLDSADLLGRRDVVGPAPRTSSPRPVPVAASLVSTTTPSAPSSPSPPLFRAAAAPVVDKPAPKPGEEFDLVGLVGEGGVRSAILRDRVSSQTWTVTQGGRVAGWKVTAIGSGCASLGRGRQRQKVCG